MRIVNVGYHYCHPADFSIYRPHGSGDYVLLILKTAAYFILDGQRREAPAHSIILFKKGTPQIFGATEKEYRNDWIHFDLEDQEARQIEAMGIPFDQILPMPTASLSELIKSMFQERYSPSPYKEKYLQIYFELMLLKITEIIQYPDSKKVHPHYDLFSTLRNEIYRAPEKEWRLEAVCQKINLSRSYIQHLYKYFFGCSLSADLSASRIEHAKYLLSSTEMTVSSISALCGYVNDVHFMRMFKKLTGTTPTQFRSCIAVSSDELKKARAHPPFSFQEKKAETK
ncbi:MAG: helix-turn-helix domain-containing protein [Clostridiales bacterium]|nr:helix-turn-helix domain-containing protein [Clostridiales bacterium]